MTKHMSVADATTLGSLGFEEDNATSRLNKKPSFIRCVFADGGPNSDYSWQDIIYNETTGLWYAIWDTQSGRREHTPEVDALTTVLVMAELQGWNWK